MHSCGAMLGKQKEWSFLPQLLPNTSSSPVRNGGLEHTSPICAEILTRFGSPRILAGNHSFYVFMNVITMSVQNFSFHGSRHPPALISSLPLSCDLPQLWWWCIEGCPAEDWASASRSHEMMFSFDAFPKKKLFLYSCLDLASNTVRYLGKQDTVCGVGTFSQWYWQCRCHHAARVKEGHGPRFCV